LADEKPSHTPEQCVAYFLDAMQEGNNEEALEWLGHIAEYLEAGNEIDADQAVEEYLSLDVEADVKEGKEHESEQSG